MQPPVFNSPRLIVRMATYQDLNAVVRYYQDNREFLRPFEPIRSPEFFTKRFWQAQIERNLLEFERGISLRLFLFQPDQPTSVIGMANFNQMTGGAFYACVLGYGLSEPFQGQGLMYEALTIAIAYAFEQLKLHRIMANYMPRNQRSGNLLKKLGFTIEGRAKDYLLINGKWEDHVLTSLLNPNWQLDPLQPTI